jgi:hypothetical protein
MYGIYDTTNGKLLSQNQWEKTFTYATARILDNILSTIHEFGADLDLETLQFKTWSEGAKIEFSVKMHPISFKMTKV